MMWCDGHLSTGYSCLLPASFVLFWAPDEEPLAPVRDVKAACRTHVAQLLDGGLAAMDRAGYVGPMKVRPVKAEG